MDVEGVYWDGAEVRTEDRQPSTEDGLQKTAVMAIPKRPKN
jgi:hypothetical protein